MFDDDDDDEQITAPTLRVNFNELRQQLLEHAEKRREIIDKMDQAYLKIEDERVEHVSHSQQPHTNKLRNEYMIQHVMLATNANNKP